METGILSEFTNPRSRPENGLGLVSKKQNGPLACHPCCCLRGGAPRPAEAEHILTPPVEAWGHFWASLTASETLISHNWYRLGPNLAK